MKTLSFLLLLSFALPTQASASVCMNLHLAYQKQKVEKKIIKRVLKQKMKPKGECPAMSWGEMSLLTLTFTLAGIFFGFLAWLIFKGSLQRWLLLGGIVGLIIALSLIVPSFF